jgi:FKBP-type peptidyl-prolyl cis-trans isomerase
MKFSVLETLAEGSGGSTPRCGDKVVVHYTGRLAGGKVFDCSRDRGFAMTFPVGVGKVIEGWDDAVATMIEGQRIRVLIPAEFAYGPKGRPPVIPPGADLEFDIELLNVNETLVEEGMRIRREEAARADKFLKLQDQERAAEADAAGGHEGPKAPKRRRADDSSGGSSDSDSGSDSDTHSSSGSSSSSSSESSHAARKRRKREKREKRHKEKKRREKKHRSHKHRHGKHKKEKHKKHRSDKGEKRKKEKRKKTAAAPAKATWGKNGVLREGDMYTKQEEFFAWLGEVKGVPYEQLGQREVKEYFSSYCEDYNTSTLPSDKYIDMRKWHAAEQRRIATEGAAAVEQEGLAERTTFDDEGDRARELARQRAARSSDVTKVMMNAMRTSGPDGLVADMRAQEADKHRMRAAYQTGDTAKARDMIQKLDPKYVSEAELRSIFGGPSVQNKARPPKKGSGG